MSSASADRERRQFDLMSSRLSRFRSGDLSIGPLIADLKALLYALEETPEEWKARFIEEWSVLEIAYAVALDRKESLPTIADGDVADAIKNLTLLIEGQTN